MKLFSIWPEVDSKLFRIDVTMENVDEKSLVYRKCTTHRRHKITEHHYAMLGMSHQNLHDAALEHCKDLIGSVSVDISELRITPNFKFTCLKCYKKTRKVKIKEIANIFDIKDVRKRNISINRWIQRNEDEPLMGFMDILPQMMYSVGRVDSLKLKFRIAVGDMYVSFRTLFGRNRKKQFETE